MSVLPQRARVADLIRAGILAINDGYRMRNEELGQEGTPFVRGGDIGDGSINHETVDHIRSEFSGRIAPKLTKPWDVAFITKGTVGRVGILRPEQPPVVFAPQVAYWRSLDHAKLWPRFLFYLLRGSEFQAQLDADKTHGAMVADYVSISQQHDFRLRIPPPEQKAIADILGALDDKIDLNRRMNETLEAMARALFKSGFVDFDPVRAKAEGRQPSGMDAETAKLFPSEFVESELGPIPRGWRVGRVEDIATVVGGSTPSTSKPEYWEGGSHYWATPKDLARLTTPVLTCTERKITAAGLSQISSGLLPPGSVLLSSRAPIGYLAIAEMPVAINQGFIGMLPTHVPNLFLLRWAECAHDEIVSRANGSTFLEISKTNFRPIPLVVPPPAILQAFGLSCRLFHSRVVANEKQSITLAKLRDALLPRLLSGELRVRDAERIASVAT